ncbi:MAG: AAA family ATPase [Candidatus Freyarchaeota archaeon]|nr:AAA family ATPase [Candidatus Jordarchaeia archaeon]MBS7270089.1 AAA family ATPase [Candidatus Jordarchaeia archaeon]MBS7280765.1 AAA family ATPase [Candidatus Jordarchaeia archaeon]
MLSVERNAPVELLGLLEQGRYSIHIKGPPGSGKTTLALELVKSISLGNKAAIYISTRVSPDRLLAQFPWISECLDEQNIVDAKRSYLSSDLPKRGGLEYTEQPEFIRLINERIRRSEQGPITVIIDSLDALKANLNISDRDTTLESILLELGANTNTNMIFVTELGESQKLDYLTDAVVRLERGIMNDRLVRKLYLEKLRGGEIKQPFYLFSLRNGRFTIFEPVRFPQVRFGLQKPEPLEERKPIPTGIEELDSILGGGLIKGTINLIEVAKGMVTEPAYFGFPILLSFIQRGLPVFVTSPQTAKTQISVDILLRLLGLGKDEKALTLFTKYVYFLVHTKEVTNEFNEIGVSKEGMQEFLADFHNAVTDVTKRLGADTFLWYLGVDSLERIYGEEALRRHLGSLVLELGRLNGICLAVAKRGIQCMDNLRHLSSFYFVMDRMGTTVIYGETPPTEIYVLVVEKLNGTNKLLLRSIQ